MFLALATSLGKWSIDLCNTLGGLMLFLWQLSKTAVTTRPKIGKLLTQMESIGVDSFLIVILTGGFAGAVLAFQSYIGFKRYGSVEFIGPLVALSMTREIGPVITGLMVTGRSGSAIAAELGTMRITEQIDALSTLNINPFQYLVVPRVIAGIVIMPFVTTFSMMAGIIGGYCVCVYVLNLNSQEYIDGIMKYLELNDVINGLIKSSVFGFILTWVGSFKGYKAFGGARGVGIATTQSVVTGSILLIIANYFLTALLF